MKLYKQYLKERDSAELIYNDYGFCTYSMNEKLIYVSEIYVVPEKRLTPCAYKLFMEAVKIGTDNGCTQILGSYDITTRNWIRSKKLMQKLGFKFYKKENNLVFFIRDLTGLIK